MNDLITLVSMHLLSKSIFNKVTGVKLFVNITKHLEFIIVIQTKHCLKKSVTMG